MNGAQISDRQASRVSMGVFFGFFVAVVAKYVDGIYHLHPYPRNTFLVLPLIRFTDFFGIVHNAGLNPYFSSLPSAQFPFLNFVAFLFSLFPDEVAFGLFMLLSALPVFLLIRKTVRSESSTLYALILTLGAYPMLLIWDRGNFEGLVFSALLMTIWWLQSGKYRWASVMLGLAIAFKAFPLVFLYLFWRKKLYREIAVCLGVTLLATILPLMVFEGGFFKNILFLIHGQNFAQPAVEAILFNPDLSQRGVTLYSFFKVCMIYLNVKVDLRHFLRLYLIGGFISFAGLWFFILRKTADLFSQASLLIIAVILLPQLSADYKLVHVLTIFLLFLGHRWPAKSEALMLAATAVLLIPKPYGYLYKLISDAGTNDLTISMFMNPLLLMFMGILIIMNRPKARPTGG